MPDPAPVPPPEPGVPPPPAPDLSPSPSPPAAPKPEIDRDRKSADPVASDIADDKAGRPRTVGEMLPPPGTDIETFWQRGATQLAIFLTLSLIFLFTDAAILQETLDRKEVAVAYKAMILAWLGAFGIHQTKVGLRWK